jgi:hypothetical protein
MVTPRVSTEVDDPANRVRRTASPGLLAPFRDQDLEAFLRSIIRRRISLAASLESF